MGAEKPLSRSLRAPVVRRALNVGLLLFGCGGEKGVFPILAPATIRRMRRRGIIAAFR